VAGAGRSSKYARHGVTGLGSPCSRGRTPASRLSLPQDAGRDLLGVYPCRRCRCSSWCPCALDRAHVRSGGDRRPLFATVPTRTSRSCENPTTDGASPPSASGITTGFAGLRDTHDRVGRSEVDTLLLWHVCCSPLLSLVSSASCVLLSPARTDGCATRTLLAWVTHPDWICTHSYNKLIHHCNKFSAPPPCV